MTAEETARRIVGVKAGSTGGIAALFERQVQQTAQAIREAEDAAFKRAAKAADDYVERPLKCNPPANICREDLYEGASEDTAHAIYDAILKLMHKAG